MNAASLHASDLARRKHLPHEIPAWVEDGTTYFITICTTPKSRNQLCIPQVAHRIQESMHFRQERGEWWMPLLLLMPDHLHALMSFARAPGMKRSISLWKRYVARTLSVTWQDGFFDHRLRNDESMQEKAHYIRMNPVRAGLVKDAESWPYVWPPLIRR